jgi:hypothetical protein
MLEIEAKTLIVEKRLNKIEKQRCKPPRKKMRAARVSLKIPKSLILNVNRQLKSKLKKNMAEI